VRFLRSNALALELRDLFTNYRSIAWVAWCGIFLTSVISVALGLAGASIRAQLELDLEREQSGAILIESGSAIPPTCSLSMTECPTPDRVIDDHFVAIVRRAFGVRHVGELRESVVAISARQAALRRTRLLRVNEPWLRLQPITLLAGRDFTSTDFGDGPLVALVGGRLHDSLTKVTGASPTGIELLGAHYRIVGVVESGLTAATSFDNTVVLPLRRRFRGARPCDHKAVGAYG
jgi:MacB-like periplasmic core domain